jgi:hypothetical protein
MSLIVVELRPLMVRKRTALRGLYNVSDETIPAAFCRSRLARQDLCQWNLCSLLNALPWEKVTTASNTKTA